MNGEESGETPFIVAERREEKKRIREGMGSQKVKSISFNKKDNEDEKERGDNE